MLNLEAWVQLQELYRQGMSQSQIARELGLDRKTVRKYLNSRRGVIRSGCGGRARLTRYVAYLRE